MVEAMHRMCAVCRSRAQRKYHGSPARDWLLLAIPRGPGDRDTITNYNRYRKEFSVHETPIDSSMKSTITHSMFCFLALIGSALAQAEPAEQFDAADFAKVEKIDIHFHLHSADTKFMELAKRDRFSILNIATQSAPADVMREKHRTIFLQHAAHPDRVAPVSSFSMDGWDDDDWQQKTIQFLDDTFEKGAVGVKVWKNIGMVFRDKTGKLVMIDNASAGSRYSITFSNAASS